jgi:hypothetical protein
MAQPPTYSAPQPPPPARPDGKPLLVLVLTLVTVVCAGLAVVVAANRRDHGTGRLTGMTPAGTALPSGVPTEVRSMLSGLSTPHAGAHFHGDLRTLLVLAPPGSTPWADPPGTDRNLSLEQAAGQYAHPDRIRADLVSNHFTHGAVQSWDLDSSKYEVQLLQFDTDAHAAAFLTSHQNGHRDAYGAQNCGPITPAPRSMVCFDPKPDANGNAGGVAIFGQHAIVGVVAVVQQVPGSRDVVAGVGLLQWTRLG